jgi:hypothetical protein
VAITCGPESELSPLEGSVGGSVEFGDRFAISEQLVTESTIPIDAKMSFTVVKGVEECGVRKPDGMADVIPRITGINYTSLIKSCSMIQKHV